MKNKLLQSFFLLLMIANILSAQDVAPKGTYNLAFGNYYFEVDPVFGARISSFKVNGKELLFIENKTGILWGSVLWPSPQSEWEWPPSKELDEYPHKVEIMGKQLIMTSKTDPKTKVSFKKTFSASKKEQSVSLLYTVINEGTSKTKKSAWEVTRVPAAGLSFFPKGEGKIFGKLAEFEEKDGMVWYQHDKSHKGDRKFYSDGSEGWFAHVTKDNLLFIKQFIDVPADKAAPNEAEIELYLTPDHTYIELENQGEYVELEPGKSADYLVKWYLRELPSEIKTEIGNLDLANYVREILGLPKVEKTRVQEKNITKELKCSVFPNPASEFIKFQNIPTGEYNIKIYDLTGNLVIEKSTHSSLNALPVSELKNGMYVYVVESILETFKGNFEILD